MTINKDNERTTIVFPKSDLKQLQKIADSEDRSLGFIVRKAVSQFLETIKGAK